MAYRLRLDRPVMIENTSSMDRPVAAQRNPRVLAGAAAGVVLLIGLAIAFPTIRRWSRAERAVDGSTLRLGTVTRGDLLRDLTGAQAEPAAHHAPHL